MKPLGEVLAKVIDYRGKAPPKAPDGIRLITARNVRPGSLDLSHAEFIEREEYEGWMNRGLPTQGDILFTTEAPLAHVCMYPKYGTYAVGQRIVTLRPDQRQMNSHFLCQYLLSEEGQRKIDIRSTGSTAKGIKSRELMKVPTPVPPLQEQRKIAAILQTWDEALEKLITLRALKSRRLEGLAQKTIGRGGAFPEHWQQKRLSEVSSSIKRKSSGGDHPVMTISAKSGFLMQSDKFARDMAGRSVERYTLLHEGEFAYNKGNSKTAPYGCIYRLNRDTALVPFVYYCFAMKPGLDPEFYDHLFSAGALNHQLSRLINSGVRNDGLLNLYSDDFFNCRVPVPPIEEQRRIAKALTAAKQEVSLLDEEIAALTDQKRGLMQKLLTGEWRVEVSDEDEAAA